MFKNFYDLLEFNKNNFGSKTALICENEKLSYSDLYLEVSKIRNFLLELGVKSGDKVGILLKNSNSFIALFLAIGSIGAVPVPINIFFKSSEIDYVLKDSSAKFLFTSKDFKKNLSPNEDIIFIEKMHNLLTKPNFNKFDTSNSLANIIYTSGTSSNPKGVMLTYDNIFSNLNDCKIAFGVNNKDRFIVYLPMFHSFTLSVGVLLPLFLGASIVVIKSVFPFSNIIKQILLKRVSVFLGIPAIYLALSKAKLPWYFKLFNNLKYFICGSAPLAKSTIEEFNKKFPKALLCEGYGLSECSPVVSVNTKKDYRVTSVGKPLPSIEVKIVDENLIELNKNEIGEIIIKGPNVMSGYLNKPEINDIVLCNGWLRTGDLGRVDNDGFLYIVDRLKDLIISKGINIYPREIEEVVLKFSGIKSCAVVGLKDESLDEEVVLFIEPEENIHIKKEEIFKFLKSKLANYKLPKHIFITKKLPTNATGKVLKRELKANIKEFMRWGI